MSKPEENPTPKTVTFQEKTPEQAPTATPQPESKYEKAAKLLEEVLKQTGISSIKKDSTIDQIITDCEQYLETQGE